MKKIIQTLFLILISYFSYEAMMTAFFVFAYPALPANLKMDAGFCDTAACCVMLIVYGIWYWFLVKRSKETEAAERIETEQKETLVNSSSLWKKVLSIGVLTLGMGGISNGWLWSVEHFLYKIPMIGKSYQAMEKAFSGVQDGHMIFALLSIAIIGPIVEELLFRGILYKYFEQLSKKWLVPILGTALLFGIWHGIFVQCVYTAICGIVFAIVFYRTRDIKVVMIIHIINNLLSFISTIPKLEVISKVSDAAGYVLIIPMLYLVFIEVKNIGGCKKNEQIG